ncbi:MAG TPA: protein translocase subunit SecD [Gemmatimonadaceae bacterium]|jgi:preprotein translocase subunit SecD
MPLKYRVLTIVGLCLLSAFFLFPRTITERVRGSDGLMHDVPSRHVPLQKGLDLKGGTYLALEVDDSKQAIPADKKADAIERALKSVRTRIDGSGMTEAVVQKQGNDRIIVSIPGESDPERAKRLVEQQAFLEFKITDKTQALERALPKIDQIIKQHGLAAVAGAATPAASSPANKGLQGLLTTADTTKKTDTTKADSSKKKNAVASAKTDSANSDTVKIQPGGAFSSLFEQGQLPGEFYVEASKIPTLSNYLADSAVNAAIPPGKELDAGTDSTFLQGNWYKSYYLLDAKPIATGENLINAQPNQSPEGVVVEFTMDNVGGRQFEKQTSKHIGDYMAIVLDGRVMTAPVIQGAISTRGQITMGGKGLSDAQDLALVLRAGALPVPLRVAQVQTIGPTLGQDSIDQGMRAMVIAVTLVVVIMIGYYRFSGMLAVGGLVLYMLYTLAALAGFGAVLTLPGIAGFVLSIGMAVDSNVLIFERIREELDRGKTVRTAIDEGFRHAMPAIVDSNVSTMLTAAVLYQYGTEAVQGFAVTLMAGIAASLITSIFVVRTFYLLWLNRSRGAQTLSI